MTQPRFATNEDFLSGSDSEIRKYLQVHPVKVEHHPDFLRAFQTATQLIAPALNRPVFLHVIIGSPPFELQIGRNKLIFDQSETIAGTHLNGVIFLNVDNLRQCTPKMMTAGILEELVHGMMNIRDELLVRTTVAYLFPEVYATPTGYGEAAS